ncbi:MULTISPECIES: MBOAT family O-acyltransferase [unclassified Flavobacterium]|jgi:D-alanyl-lipoteichoic acid acyltransferase DltB (MBOAT superfamily)|uniref:MBOAT family O-acyltransferase n=1 Tax=unclassified Flavobacterium TaxID=196869 RepID=UPI0025C6880D|nr:MULTISPECIES: MBOAT family O-acyltransferase [unclassified Flavobacterium]
MLFNALQFLLFLPIVFMVYWWVNKKSLQLQNLLLLVASYFFYGCWDWRFLFLLLFSTALDYFTAIKMVEAKNKGNKIFWFWLSIIVNLGFLGVLKYYNFFADSFAEALSGLGIQTNFWTLKVILPVGISFYTFHGLSYVIDIYKGRIQPEKNIITYSLFVAYFPLLVAGPIERATHLLPQIRKRRFFDYNTAIDGVHQIIWGLFKKVVIADNCALYVNDIFDNYQSMNSLSLFLGAIYFSFQIYGDFSGYSDIAVGTSKLFGIDLLRNFNYPCFSRDIAEFWRRWHISLSSWFRDYLYIPLGGSKGGMWMKIRNTFIIFLVSGFWHGANWTFIVWGALHAAYFLPLLITQNNRNNLDSVARGKSLPTFKELASMVFTFSLTTFAWIFFRAKTVSEACSYIKNMFSFNFNGKIQFLDFERYSIELLLLLGLFVVLEWNSREREHFISGKWVTVKAILILTAILILGAFSSPSDFIYFQF